MCEPEARLMRRRRLRGRAARHFPLMGTGCAIWGSRGRIAADHNIQSDPARETASVRVPTASFEKIRLTCDFTVSGEISRVRAMRLLEKPWLIIPRISRSRAVSRSLALVCAQRLAEYRIFLRSSN